MRQSIAAAALLASLPLGLRPALAQNLNVSVRSGHDVRTCDDLEVPTHAVLWSDLPRGSGRAAGP